MAHVMLLDALLLSPAVTSSRLFFFALLSGVAWLAAAAPASAAEPVDLARPATPAGSVWRLDAGVYTATPAALGTGLSGGVAIGLARSGTWSWGTRLSYSQATEYAPTWAVTHHELRARVNGALQTGLGRGWLGVRLGAGVTTLYETRARAQAARLGAAAAGLDTSTWAALPAAELEGFVALPVYGPVGLGLAAGPTVHVFQGAVVPGWLVQLTGVWWP